MKKKTKKKTKAQLAKEAKRARMKAWKELSAQIRAEVGKCEVCGSTERLNIHHCLGRKTHPAFMFDRANLICLCARHHFLLHHGHEWEFATWLKANKPGQWAWICDQARKNGF